MKNISTISKAPIFRGLTEPEIEEALSCLGAGTKAYKKDEMIYRIGDSVHHIGLVLSGGTNVIRYDIWGNQNILDHVEPGQIFAEAYACIPDECLTVTVLATSVTEILFLDVNKIVKQCPSSCYHHSRLLQNLLSVMAGKNINLTRKMSHITPKSIRERLLSYLSYESAKQGKLKFEIPFNRQELADYLSVDRSALSNELSKMQKDGIITYKKNKFALHN